MEESRSLFPCTAAAAESRPIDSITSTPHASLVACHGAVIMPELEVVHKLLPTMPQDVALWASAIKAALPHAKLGERKRIEIAMKRYAEDGALSSTVMPPVTPPSMPLTAAPPHAAPTGAVLPSTVPASAASPSAALPASSQASDATAVPTTAAAATSTPAAALPAMLTAKSLLVTLAATPSFDESQPLEWWEVVHFPHVIVRASPSTSAKAISHARAGDIMAISAVEWHDGRPWARLATPERNNLAVNYTQAHTAPEAFALIDGRSLGFGDLLRRAATVDHPPLGVWALAHRLYDAAVEARDERLCRVGLPGRVRYARLSYTALAEEDRAPVAPQQARSLEGRVESLVFNGGNGGGTRGGGTDASGSFAWMSQQYLSCWRAVEPVERDAHGGGSNDDSSGGSTAGGDDAQRATPSSRPPFEPPVRTLLGSADGRPPFPAGANRRRRGTATEDVSATAMGAAGVEGGKGSARGAATAGGMRERPPRLAIALLLRGASTQTVSDWCAYHLAVGFEALYMYFDEPTDQAIAAAQAHAPHARVTACTPDYWNLQRRTNAFFTSPAFDPFGMDMCDHMCTWHVRSHVHVACAIACARGMRDHVCTWHAHVRVHVCTHPTARPRNVHPIPLVPTIPHPIDFLTWRHPDRSPMRSPMRGQAGG